MFQFQTRNRYDQQSIGGNQTTPAGFYPAKVLAVEPMRSRSGKDMLKLTIEVDAGGVRCIETTDYLILHSDFAWKIEQYLAAVGRQFGAGENITIDNNTFLGCKFTALTCNEPGVKNPDRLYLKVMHALRAQDAPHKGALTPDELEYYGLNADGTQRNSVTERRAVAQQQQPQNAMWSNPAPMGQHPGGNAWGQAPQQQPHPGHQQPQNGWQQGNAQPAPVDNMADDDIPF